MPARLPEPTTKWTGRLHTRDLDLLEATYGPGVVNKVIREMVERHCNRLREVLAGQRVA